jgi:hypothetical protein
LGVPFGHLVYIFYGQFGIHILWSFGAFLSVWYVVPRQIWQPWSWAAKGCLNAEQANHDLQKVKVIRLNELS